MAKPIYSAIASLDGYLADEDGNFDWAAPCASATEARPERPRPPLFWLFYNEF
jgi:hypothetical protein